MSVSCRIAKDHRASGEAPDLPIERVAEPCEEHDPCDGCGWCPCYETDPAGNRPAAPFGHDWWHQALAEGLVR